MVEREKQQVLVADDQHFFRSGLRTLLATEADLQIVADAFTVADAIVKEQLTAPNVIVISSSLLAVASSEERRQMRQWNERASLVLIEEGESPSAAEEISAVRVVSRRAPASQIVGTIRYAAQKDEALSASNRAVDLKALSEIHFAKAAVLTSREQDVVKLLAEGRTARETAAKLSLSIKTIESHRLNIMRKLDIHNRKSLVDYAISQQLVTLTPA